MVHLFIKSFPGGQTCNLIRDKECVLKVASTMEKFENAVAVGYRGWFV
jgi:hypothetical protein